MQRDGFNERLERRLKVLDASVPPASGRYDHDVGYIETGHRNRVSVDGRFPIGIAAAVVVLAVAVAALGIVRPNSGTGASSPPAATSPGGSTAVERGMNVTDSAAVFSATHGQLLVHLSITNATGQDDRLVGASSTAATARLYEYYLCSPVPSGQGEPCPGPTVIAWMPLRAGETVEFDGLVLSGFQAAPVPGDTVTVTLLFASASPVTVQVPVLAQWPTFAAPSK